MLNNVGDTTLLSLPVLHTSQGLLVAVTPWLAAPAGGPAASLELAARDYGWQ
jgi:hypothetical protein